MSSGFLATLSLTAETLPATGALMGNAAFTDSRVATSPSWAALLPRGGSSTKTTSVTSFCAWSVMPTVPSGAIHSWDLANRSFSMSCMASFSLFFASRIEREPGRFRGHGAPVALDGEGSGESHGDISHGDPGLERGGECPAGHEARHIGAAEDLKTVPGDPPF